jgi:hypothetical protein
MKKYLILLILSFYSLIAFGQTYSAEVIYNIPVTKFCWDGKYGWRLTGFNGVDESKTHNETYNINEAFDIPNVSSFNFELISTCFDRSGGLICNGSSAKMIPASELIMSGSNLIEGCGESIEITSFKPNLTIQNLTSSSICAGEQLDLEASPRDFPPVAYHWQYSLDNQITWIDVPMKKVNGLDINNVKNSNFTIYDILGDDHLNHFGDIYFRIGYGQARPFTSSIKIVYSPCAPLVTDVKFDGPKCKDDYIQKLDIYFNEPLDARKGESLYQLYLRETVNNTGLIKTDPFMQVNNVTYPSDTKIYSYSNFSNFTKLESGRQYEVIYQAQVNDPFDPTKKILKGVLVYGEKFTYYEPSELKFKADPINPLCNNDPAKIAISATGGTPPYFYILDNDAPIEFRSPIEVPIKGLIKDPHTVKVIDKNSCTEK